MEDANGRDLTQFRRWYSQAGTPHVHVTRTASADGFDLVFRQTTPSTPGQTDKQPQHMPVLLSAYSHGGELLTLHSEQLQLHESGSYLFELTQT